MSEQEQLKGYISEEALDDVAGGFGVSKETAKKILIGSGITVVALGYGVGMFELGHKYGGKVHDKVFGSKKTSTLDKQTVNVIDKPADKPQRDV